jgi:4-hydroxy-4-methyl-2-oxoglutarate aldolase
VGQLLRPALIDALQRLDTCSAANAIETFDVRLRNEGFTRSLRCLFGERPPVAGYAVTTKIRTATPPSVGHAYHDRTDWWNYIQTVPAPRFVVVQDLDEPPGLGAFIGEVHANILSALGCAALATNGAIRDLPKAGAAGLQLFARSLSPSHAFTHIIDFSEPIELEGLRIESGDLLLGDRHGIVKVPPSLAAGLPAAVASMQARERRVIEFCRSEDFSVDRLRMLVEGLD